MALSTNIIYPQLKTTIVVSILTDYSTNYFIFFKLNFFFKFYN